jgi:hypothetical protein
VVEGYAYGLRLLTAAALRHLPPNQLDGVLPKDLEGQNY